MKWLCLVAMILIGGNCRSQQIYLGFGGGLQKLSEAYIQTDSFSLTTRNNTDRKMLYPYVGIMFNATKKFSFALGITYNKETISLSAWDNQADTCLLCPKIVGGGPTIREISFSGNLRGTLFKSGRNLKSFLWVGITLGVRFDGTSNVSTIRRNLTNRILRSAESIYDKNVFGSQIGISFEARKLQVTFLYKLEGQHTENLIHHNIAIPFKIMSSGWKVNIGYRIFRVNSS